MSKSKRLSRKQILRRFDDGDFPTTSAGGLFAIWDSGGVATMRLMRTLEREGLIARPTSDSVYAKWSRVSPSDVPGVDAALSNGGEISIWRVADPDQQYPWRAEIHSHGFDKTEIGRTAEEAFSRAMERVRDETRLPGQPRPGSSILSEQRPADPRLCARCDRVLTERDCALGLRSCPQCIDELHRRGYDFHLTREGGAETYCGKFSTSFPSDQVLGLPTETDPEFDLSQVSCPGCRRALKESQAQEDGDDRCEPRVEETPTFGELLQQQEEDGLAFSADGFNPDQI